MPNPMIKAGNHGEFGDAPHARKNPIEEMTLPAIEIALNPKRGMRRETIGPTRSVRLSMILPQVWNQKREMSELASLTESYITEYENATPSKTKLLIKDETTIIQPQPPSGGSIT